MSKKIKILHIIKTLSFGGAEMNLLNLAQRFDSNRFEIHVAYSGNGELRNVFQENNIRLFRFISQPCKLKSPALPVIVGRLSWYLLQNKIDIVHTHTFNAHVWGTLAAKLTGRKVVEHVHDSRYQNPDEFFLRGEMSRQYTHIKNFRNISDRTVVLTKQNFDFVVKNKINKLEKVRKIPNGIPLEKREPYSDVEKNKLRKELSISLVSPVVLMPIRFSPEKNTELVLRIASFVRETIPDCSFVLAGAGPLLSNFQKQVAEQGLENMIRTPGFYPDMDKLLSIADIFLLPSKLELHSIAILEAMRQKVPVVVSKGVGCNDEFITDWENGVLLDPFKSDGWAPAIVRLLNDAPLRAQIGEAGYQTLLERFDIKEIAKKFENLYVELTRI